MVEVKVMSGFEQYTEQDIWKALESIEESAISNEVARLVCLYSQNFYEHCQKIGKIPDSIIQKRGECPIETIALFLTNEQIKAALSGKF